LVRPLGTILPCAEAIRSTEPRLAQASARQKAAIRVKEMARPIGEGGVSTISSAAGRKASPSTGRSWRAPGTVLWTVVSALADDFMDSRL
jgi:hypothetical protein